MTNISSDSSKATKLLHGQCWEDAEVILKAHKPKPDSQQLVIGSAGDIALSFLVTNPQQLLVVDQSQIQCALIALKKAAFKNLSYKDLLKFLGATQGENRFALYQQCQHDLPDYAVQFWNNHLPAIEAGVINAGLFEQYLSLLRTKIIKWGKVKPESIQQLFTNLTTAERVTLVNNKIANWKWDLLLQLWLSQKFMSFYFKDTNLFKQVAPSHENRLVKYFNKTLSEQNTRTNPALNWLFLGRYKSALPHYLREANYEKIKANLDKLQIVHNNLASFLATNQQKFGHIHLSDIFDLMAYDNYCQHIEALLDHTQTGSKISYFNFMVPRQRPQKLIHKITTHYDLAKELMHHNKYPFYDHFVVEEISAK